MKTTSTANKNATRTNSSASSHLKAWKWFEEHGYKQHKGLVLHHIDTTMKSRDPERYNEWRPEDLQVMTVQEHRRLHMKKQTKGVKHTKQHNIKISEGIREQLTKGKMVKIHMRPVEAQTLYFSTLAQAADFIGCTRQLVSQCIRDNTHNRRAKGWDISLVDSADANELK